VRRFRLVALAATVLLAATGSARAQVTIDPDSPSAKEYAIPLENERRQADPGRAPGAGVTQGERSSPLFGEGIEPPDRSQGAAERDAGAAERDGGARRSGGGSDTSGRDREGSAKESSRAPDIVRAATANPGAPDGGLGTPAVIGGVALAVLLLGGLAGVLVRRRA
jgi:hypothetical protein